MLAVVITVIVPGVVHAEETDTISMVRGESITFALPDKICKVINNAQEITYDWTTSDDGLLRLSEKTATTVKITAVEGMSFREKVEFSAEMTLKSGFYRELNYVICVDVKEKRIESIMVNPSNVSMYVGESTRVNYSYSPSDVKNPRITWYSTNQAVASIDAQRNVKALSAGVAEIVFEDEGGAKASCVVSVSEKPKGHPVESISLTPSRCYLTVGESISLTAKVLPSNATDKRVRWSSTNDYVATVNEHGRVEAVGLGSTDIYCRALDGSNVAAVCRVTVGVESVDVDQWAGSYTLYADYYDSANKGTRTFPTKSTMTIRLSGNNLYFVSYLGYDLTKYNKLDDCRLAIEGNKAWLDRDTKLLYLNPARNLMVYLEKPMYIYPDGTIALGFTTISDQSGKTVNYDAENVVAERSGYDPAESSWAGDYSVNGLRMNKGSKTYEPVSFGITIARDGSRYYLKNLMGVEVVAYNEQERLTLNMLRNDFAIVQTPIEFDDWRNASSYIYLMGDYHYAGNYTLSFRKLSAGKLAISGFDYWRKDSGERTCLADYSHLIAFPITSGIENVADDAAIGEISVADGIILLPHEIDVAVYGLDGRLVYRARTNCISGLPAGLYVVRTHGASHKVMVR